MHTIQREFIKDQSGTPIGVILPIEELTLVKDILEKRKAEPHTLEDKLRMMEEAAIDPLYLADLKETMDAFSLVDAEWWEQSE